MDIEAMHEAWLCDSIEYGYIAIDESPWVNEHDLDPDGDGYAEIPNEKFIDKDRTLEEIGVILCPSREGSDIESVLDDYYQSNCCDDFPDIGDCILNGYVAENRMWETNSENDGSDTVLKILDSLNDMYFVTDGEFYFENGGFPWRAIFDRKEKRWYAVLNSET